MGPPPSHRQDTFSEVLSRELGEFINSKSATFACGGCIPIVTNHSIVRSDNNIISGAGNPGNVCDVVEASEAGEADEVAEAEEVAETENASNAGSASACDTFSDSSVTSETTSATSQSITADSEARLNQLVQDCQPASFGYKGKDLGIIDTIAQMLLPNTSSRTNGVRAELYKLNVYSAPCGFFKSHVDTPRKRVTFDWGASATGGGAVDAAVHWAAFYSDCEHEVLELIEGHRITLTYNLYFSLGIGDMAKNSLSTDIQNLPLYHKVKDTLAEPDFMPEGGYLGVYCSHAYAHSTAEGARALPAVLKGSDMAVFAVFRALGLPVKVRAVLDDDDNMYVYDPATNTRIPERSQTANRVSHGIGKVLITSAGSYSDSGWPDVWEDWPHRDMEINWLTEERPDHKNLEIVHLTYGNDAGIGEIYSNAALLVKIPSSARRSQRE
ncbi:hypothetical protein B0H63DRAFT_560784 [Podospora didyma]|uniref:Fe2OG dioxygenase domain-containing protein n=1 Tax=Podospora didyma TaxID=330526 RepID=A0AAE0TVH9_9PEZI|nr:hypothetical protein B0H63DRAFT_560784 [Podospora didyma]